MSQSASAVDALQLVESFQLRFVRGLEVVSSKYRSSPTFEKSEWLRDDGIHGGGSRFSISEDIVHPLFNRASVNVSQIHYDDLPEKQLGSATALSTIIHPRNPYAPSVHIHVSWTEMKSGKGYWRMMADLNPSIPHAAQTQQFKDSLKNITPELYDAASAQGDRYFYIPALDRHRGAAHFYLEGYCTGDAEADKSLAESLGNTAIDQYLMILNASLEAHSDISEEAKLKQLNYHTLYFFQVLTLDRGTTSGLLVHDQNDIGIMGSLPAQISSPLLTSWRSKLQKPQDELLDQLLLCLPEGEICAITKIEKAKLAQAVRQHYTKKPEALKFQASGNILPPTVENHK